MNILHQAELELKYNLILVCFTLLILIIMLLAVSVYFYIQEINCLKNEEIFLEKYREKLREESGKIYPVKKLEMSTLQVSPKEDGFNPVKNIDLLEEAIIKLYDTNNYLEDKIEELRTEKES
ncbi:hypothetical protein ABY99_13870 [Listeria monocytogenes]|nr:hypothetical protein [Listeria monocytogenes]